MSQVRNATDFLLRLEDIDRTYKVRLGQVYDRQRELLTSIATGATPGTPRSIVLEAHIRQHFIDEVLAALNWALRPQSDLPSQLSVEVPIRSQERRTVRFFDYLGVEVNTFRPLLLVETKRPNSLPPERHNMAEEVGDSYAGAVAAGLRGYRLRGEWNEWLETLRDYVDSLKAQTNHVPQRVVITDGDWLVIFLDPADAFLPDGTKDPNFIAVFSSRDEVKRCHAQCFGYLEYHAVLGQAPALAPGDVPFYVRPEDLERVTYGVRLLYEDQQTLYDGPSPSIRVAPMLFMRLRQGAWIRVEGSRDYVVPHDSHDLICHLLEVERCAKDLLDGTANALGTELVPTSLAAHYSDPDVFSGLKGVAVEDTFCAGTATRYVVVTGSHAHYLRGSPSVPNCPYHDWHRCREKGVAPHQIPVLTPRTRDPRSLFKSGMLHHCAHRDVFAAKSTQITAYNRDRCGPRSSPDNAPFCEVYSFEQHLCCRTCAFEEVCTRAEVFHLPCQLPG